MSIKEISSMINLKKTLQILNNLFFVVDFKLTSYELQVTSYGLLLIAPVTSYLLHSSYELLFIAQVTSSLLNTSYKLLFIARVTSYELRVTIYCTSWDFNADCVKLLYYTSHSFLWPALNKIKYSSPAIPEQCIS